MVDVRTCVWLVHQKHQVVALRLSARVRIISSWKQMERLVKQIVALRNMNAEEMTIGKIDKRAGQKDKYNSRRLYDEFNETRDLFTWYSEFEETKYASTYVNEEPIGKFGRARIGLVLHVKVNRKEKVGGHTIYSMQ